MPENFSNVSTDKTNSNYDPLNHPRSSFGRNPSRRARQQNNGRPEADQGVSAQPGRLGRAHSLQTNQSAERRLTIRQRYAILLGPKLDN
jgi:hypothetical protein